MTHFDSALFNLEQLKYNMGARKEGEKEKKATGAEGSDMILHYLRALLYPTSSGASY